jgi:LPXTG-motif cell wall-anchored protein
MRKLRITTLGGLLALIGTAVLTAALAAPAAADFNYRDFNYRQLSATADCRTVTTAIADRPDSGTGGDWAKDTFTRTVKLCADATVNTKAQVKQGETWKYQVVASDDGTFTTTGPHSPGHSMPLMVGLTGAFTGGFSATITGPAAFDGLNPHPASTNAKSSGEWIGYIWPGSAGGDKLTAWGWTYKLCNETWINSADGNKGDITGASRVPCFGNPSFTPKCDGTVVVTLVNAAPSAHSIAVYHVTGLAAAGGNVLVPGGKPGQVSVVATPDAKGVVTVTYGFGDKKTVKTFTWTKPKDCAATPSPTVPGPTPTTSAPAGLPVTGPNTTIAAAAGGVLLTVGAGVLLLLRRRRVRFEE